MTIRPIPVRVPRFEFSEIPRWWMGGNPFLTHAANGINFVFPAGERFFIRSVRYYEDTIVDEDLREQIKAFYGQEAQHQREHTRAFTILEEQGYEIRSFLEWYEELAYEELEPMLDPILRLATTAALEHFTAILGEWALTTDDLAEAHPAMRDLLQWHAAEEIEHKSVAYDVLQSVDDRWAIRALGFAIAVTVLIYFWERGRKHLLRQEEGNLDELGGLGWRSSVERTTRLGRLIASALSFVAPGFHPDNNDNYHLAEAHFANADWQGSPA